MKKFILSMLLLVFTVPAYAGNGCYSPQEAEAEQGIRIHSELMVIGLNCMHMAKANGSNLYLEHKKFTQKHATLFASYEKIIMNFMKRNGTADTEAAMHKLRTDFANKISYDAAEMRPDIFCKTYAPRIEKATQMDETTLRKWAAMSFKEHPVSQPLCKS